jgi:peptidoglycan/LPS O-acetylase OafA/YrhL
MYALLFIVAARNETGAFSTLWIGIVYHLACMFGELGFGARYFSASAAALSFAAGALIYFWAKRGALNVSGGATALALAMWLANTVASRWLLSDDYTYGPGYYLSTFLFVIVVAGLARVEWGGLAQRIDRLLGEIAYPVFLVQWLAGFLTALVLTPGVWRGWTLTLAAIPIILLMGAAIAWMNMRLIEPLRSQLRPVASRL